MAMIPEQSKYVKCYKCGEVNIRDNDKPLSGCRWIMCGGETQRLSEWDVVLMLSNAPVTHPECER